MDPLSLSASVIALIQATATIVRYIYDFTDAKKEQDILSLEVTGLLTFLQQLRLRLDDAQEGDPWFQGCISLAGPNGTIMLLSRAVEELEVKLKPETGIKKLGPKLRWPINKASFDRLCTQIERLKSQINVVLNEDQFQISKQVLATSKETSQGVKALQNTQELDDITQWLSTLNFPTQQQQIFDGATEATGQWLLESDEFENWVSHGVATLYCPGMPGAGKTVLSSIVIDHLQRRFRSENKPVIYIYLNHKDSHDQGLPNLVGSLLRQLVQYLGEPSKRIKQLRDTRRNDSRTLVEAFHKEIASFERVCVIIDALDESIDATTRNELLELLHDPSTKNLSLLITSRPLENKFGRANATCDRCGLQSPREFYHCTICSDGNFDLCDSCVRKGSSCSNALHPLTKLYACTKIEIAASEADLKKYIDHKVATEDKLVTICRKDPNAKSSIVEKVIDAADGMFLAAKLLMDILKTKATPRALRRELEVMPETLGGIYDATLKRIEGQDEDDANLAKRIISWIVWSKRALRKAELLQALAVSPGDRDIDTREILEEDFLFSVTAGSVLVDYKGYVRLVHYTTQDYFENSKGRWFPDGPLEIATTTLTYLNFRRLQEFDHDSSSEQQARHEAYPFFTHAIDYWSDHTLECYNLSQELQKAVMTFLCDPLKVAALYGIGMNGIHVCAMLGLDDLITDLLKAGIDINLKNVDPLAQTDWGNTPLIYACSKNRLSTVKMLLKNGSSINAMYNSTALYEAWYNSTILHNAKHCRYELVKLLLEHVDIDIDCADIGGRTPLHFACATGSSDIVQALLESGADPYLEDAQGSTAIGLALHKGQLSTMRLMIHLGINIHYVNQCGETLFHEISKDGKSSGKLFDLLIGAGLDYEARDAEGFTPLHRAVMSANLDAVLTLLRKGANPFKLCDKKRTLVQIARDSGTDWLFSSLVCELMFTGNVWDHVKGQFDRELKKWAAKIEMINALKDQEDWEWLYAGRADLSEAATMDRSAWDVQQLLELLQKQDAEAENGYAEDFWSWAESGNGVNF